jgi:Tfp pilus assembly protein PilX
MAWVAFFAVVALGFYVTRAKVKDAERITAQERAREQAAKYAEARALKEAEQIRASLPAPRRGRPRKTTTP